MKKSSVEQAMANCSFSEKEKKALLEIIRYAKIYQVSKINNELVNKIQDQVNEVLKNENN